MSLSLRNLESKHRIWKRHATTVARGNGLGQQLHQLRSPYGISFDRSKTLLIADYSNHRIVGWHPRQKNGTVIAGGNESGNRTDQLNYPADVIVDRQNQSFIIADLGNRRVVRWFNRQGSQPEILIDNISCFGLAIDKDGALYVTDREKHEVRRWRDGEKEGALVAGGNGREKEHHQLDRPSFLFVDHEQSVYVSDRGNSRVIKWRQDAKEGVIVAGGKGAGERLDQLSSPHGVHVDQRGDVCVVDWANDRVMRWREGDSEGEVMAGGYGRGAKSDQLDGPMGLSFDDEKNLYVADGRNCRVQKFDFHSS